MIVKRKDGYHVLSEKGKNLGGPYGDRAAAVKRLRQVEYFKHHKTAELYKLGFHRMSDNLSQVLGIPDRTVKTRPREFTKPEIWNFNIQQHAAKRAGDHFDLRLVDPRTGIAHSWAVRSIPRLSGERVLAVHQPDHTSTYSTWEGEIAEGYGAGTVKLFSSDKVEVTKSAPDHVTFNVYRSNGDTDRFTLVHTGGNDWLFLNSTPTRYTRPELNITKPKFKSVSPKSIDVTKTTEILAPKYDGAMNAFLLRKGRPVEVFSYRPSKKGPAKLIDHTFRTRLYKTVVPDTFRGKTVLLGELFAKDPTTGKVLSSRDTASRLLSNVWRSRELQKEAPLEHVVFDVIRYEGRDVSEKPYSEKIQILKDISHKIPQIKLPPLSIDINAKQQLLNDVRSGAHPLTQEGVVVYDLNRSVPMKAKLFKDYDVRIRDIFPGEGKYKDRGAGGFFYSYPKSNKIVGRVGSGFTDQMRKDMFNDPRHYTGLVARVLAQEKLPSGALRVPVFKDLRSETWPREKLAVAMPAQESPLRREVRTIQMMMSNKLKMLKVPDSNPSANEAIFPLLGDSMDNMPSSTEVPMLKKQSALNWPKLMNDYIKPSLVAGPAMGVAVTAMTSKSKEDFKQNVGKGLTAGVAADVGTGLAMGLWNQRKSLTNLFKTAL